MATLQQFPGPPPPPPPGVPASPPSAAAKSIAAGSGEMMAGAATTRAHFGFEHGGGGEGPGDDGASINTATSTGSLSSSASDEGTVSTSAYSSGIPTLSNGGSGGTSFRTSFTTGAMSFALPPPATAPGSVDVGGGFLSVPGELQIGGGGGFGGLGLGGGPLGTPSSYHSHTSSSPPFGAAVTQSPGLGGGGGPSSGAWAAPPSSTGAPPAMALTSSSARAGGIGNGHGGHGFASPASYHHHHHHQQQQSHQQQQQQQQLQQQQQQLQQQGGLERGFNSSASLSSPGSSGSGRDGDEPGGMGGQTPASPYLHAQQQQPQQQPPLQGKVQYIGHGQGHGPSQPPSLRPRSLSDSAFAGDEGSWAVLQQQSRHGQVHGGPRALPAGLGAGPGTLHAARGGSYHQPPHHQHHHQQPPPQQSVGYQGHGVPASPQQLLPPAQAAPMVQWITHFIRQKGGVITAANLGSALARLHPEFYGLLKASHGGLTAFLAEYSDRFGFANDPPFNHVFLARDQEQQGGGNPSPMPSSVLPLASAGGAFHSETLRAQQQQQGAAGFMAKPHGANGVPLPSGPLYGSGHHAGPRHGLPLPHRSPPFSASSALSGLGPPAPLSRSFSGGALPTSMAAPSPSSVAMTAAFIEQQQHQHKHLLLAMQGLKIGGGQYSSFSDSQGQQVSPPVAATGGPFGAGDGLGAGGGPARRAPEGSYSRSSSSSSREQHWMGPQHLMQDQHLEAEVVRATSEILSNAASYALKAVELANTLRARLGTKVLAKVREKYGGLLFMLERHPTLFRVDRIPKNDCVTLLHKGLLLVTQGAAAAAAVAASPAAIAAAAEAASLHQQQAAHRPGGEGQGGGAASAYAQAFQQLQHQMAQAREREKEEQQLHSAALRWAAASTQHQHPPHPLFHLQRQRQGATSPATAAASAFLSQQHQQQQQQHLQPVQGERMPSVDLGQQQQQQQQQQSAMREQGSGMPASTASLGSAFLAMPSGNSGGGGPMIGRNSEMPMPRRHSWSSLVTTGAEGEAREEGANARPSLPSPTDAVIGPPAPPGLGSGVGAREGSSGGGLSTSPVFHGLGGLLLEELTVNTTSPFQPVSAPALTGTTTASAATTASAGSMASSSSASSSVGAGRNGGSAYAASPTTAEAGGTAVLSPLTPDNADGPTQERAPPGGEQEHAARQPEKNDGAWAVGGEALDQEEEEENEDGAGGSGSRMPPGCEGGGGSNGGMLGLSGLGLAADGLHEERAGMASNASSVANGGGALSPSLSVGNGLGSEAASSCGPSRSNSFVNIWAMGDQAAAAAAGGPLSQHQQRQTLLQQEEVFLNRADSSGTNLVGLGGSTNTLSSLAEEAAAAAAAADGLRHVASASSLEELFASTGSGSDAGSSVGSGLALRPLSLAAAAAAAGLYGTSPAANGAAAVGAGGGGSGASVGGSASPVCPVLQILTNNHFVPTQTWPAEPLRDSAYVKLIVEELHHVGGTTTVSKLRGLIKHKLGSKETIKSVPLKALLQAYRSVFTLHRNHVSLNGTLRL